LSTIFRAYDVRGVYGKDLTVFEAAEIGAAFARLLERGPIALGRDVRLSSVPLSHAVAAGASASGLGVLDIGLCPTSTIYFAVAHRGLGGGVMVTASHNPPEYNGMKLCWEGAIPLSYEDGISEIERMCRGGLGGWAEVSGEIRGEDVLGEYVGYLLRDVAKARGMRVVVDVGNGCCGFMGSVLNGMGCEALLLNPEPDGRFPSGIVNPVVEESVEPLKKAVREQGADLGIALDPDGDRVCFVDENGEWLPGDAATAVIAAPILERRRGSEVVCDIRFSRAVTEYLEQLGARVRFSRVGHSYIARAVMRSEAVIGGEISGHIYLHDRYYGYDDGVYAAIRMVEALSARESSLSEEKSRMRKMATGPELRVHFPDDLKFRAVDVIRQRLQGGECSLNTMDGVRADYREGWLSIRASNTEPALVVRAEGETQEALKALTEKMQALVKEAARELGHSL